MQAVSPDGRSHRTTATARTTDQQNTVDWITTVAKRRNVAAAQNAAREYVKWAGLGRGNFDALMRSNPTKDQIQAFLSGTVVNYDLPRQMQPRAGAPTARPLPTAMSTRATITRFASARSSGSSCPRPPTTSS